MNVEANLLMIVLIPSRHLSIHMCLFMCSIQVLEMTYWIIKEKHFEGIHCNCWGKLQSLSLKNDTQQIISQTLKMLLMCFYVKLSLLLDVTVSHLNLVPHINSVTPSWHSEASNFCSHCQQNALCVKCKCCVTWNVARVPIIHLQLWGSVLTDWS